jgi:hypothetical protein
MYRDLAESQVNHENATPLRERGRERERERERERQTETETETKPWEWLGTVTQKFKVVWPY